MSQSVSQRVSQVVKSVYQWVSETVSQSVSEWASNSSIQSSVSVKGAVDHWVSVIRLSGPACCCLIPSTQLHPCWTFKYRPAVGLLIPILAAERGHDGGANEPLFLSVRNPRVCDVRPPGLASYAGGCTCSGHTLYHLSGALPVSNSEKNCKSCESG